MAKVSGDARVVPEGVPGAPCRINALPNDVLIRAISFLDVRQLVQTCVLSTRWRDLWRSVPRISASRDEFDGIADTEGACDELFKKFINRFLMLRNPVALDEFRLRYNIPEGSEDPDAALEHGNLWICHALQSNALSVDVFGGFFLDLHLDPAVFASKCYHVTSIQLSFASTTEEFNYRGTPLEMGQNLQWCSKFNNLTTLTLGEWCLYENFYPLIVFLQNSTNLEQLTLKLKPFRHFNNPDKRFIGDLEERSFTCEQLVRVDIVFEFFGSASKGSKDHPVLKSLVEFLHDNGITPDRIVIKDKIFPSTADVVL